MAEWLTATVVENKQWTDRLHSLKLKTAFPEFEAGQFIRLALDIDGERVSRSFSLVNAPDEDLLDVYFIEVLNGRLSPRLAALKIGDEVWVSASAKGNLTLSHLPAGAKHLYLLATGTGVGPFLSILKTSQLWQQFEKVVLVHAVRFHNELTYQDLIADIQRSQPETFSYVPFVSRELCSTGLAGRIPQALETGVFEQHIGLEITPEHSRVMLCGNPDMVRDTMEILERLYGLTKHSKREPGQINIEKYW